MGGRRIGDAAQVSRRSADEGTRPRAVLVDSGLSTSGRRDEEPLKQSTDRDARTSRATPR